MYPDVQFLEGKLVTVGEVRYHEGHRIPRKHTFLSLSSFHEVGTLFHYVKTLGRPSIPYKLFGSITS
jgi:hypothetical protein